MFATGRIPIYIIPKTVQSNSFHPDGQTEEQLWRHKYWLFAIR